MLCISIIYLTVQYPVYLLATMYSISGFLSLKMVPCVQVLTPCAKDNLLFYFWSSVLVHVCYYLFFWTFLLWNVARIHIRFCFWELSFWFSVWRLSTSFRQVGDGGRQLNRGGQWQLVPQLRGVAPPDAAHLSSAEQLPSWGTGAARSTMVYHKTPLSDNTKISLSFVWKFNVFRFASILPLEFNFLNTYKRV